MQSAAHLTRGHVQGHRCTWGNTQRPVQSNSPGGAANHGTGHRAPASVARLPWDPTTFRVSEVLQSGERPAPTKAYRTVIEGGFTTRKHETIARNRHRQAHAPTRPGTRDYATRTLTIATPFRSALRIPPVPRQPGPQHGHAPFRGTHASFSTNRTATISPGFHQGHTKAPARTGRREGDALRAQRSSPASGTRLSPVAVGGTARRHSPTRPD